MRPKPEILPDEQEFWVGLQSGRVLFPRCERCGFVWGPPSDVCPNCLSLEMAWTQLSGFGKILSWVIFHKAYSIEFQDAIPYNVVLVALDEGPRVVSNMVCCENSELALGMRVEATFGTVSDSLTVLLFKPALESK